MIEQQNGGNSQRIPEARRRQVEIAAFLAGVIVTLAFFAFFPGLPHVIDWGAVVLSLLMGGLARWGCRAWLTRTGKKQARSS
ncbi:hypothetical protein [Streptomyces griseiscabiei]|uniref:Integral membrane protein n=1 Tax=Streptomyces griseiscabiei TaxID=2993540 RepID=A0ABU4L086_9ACTN|nr:hypothetical protein [Streptomyces griseiscabiei]MBZ3900814.1 hypothetical protein [Streptomyces griseiscabiei]MDX2909059.1 hypothetical protein [Streptomyces griseiscabiei]